MKCNYKTQRKHLTTFLSEIIEEQEKTRRFLMPQVKGQGLVKAIGYEIPLI